MEFEAEAKKLKLTTDDDDVYPYALLYDRLSKDKDVEPGQTFLDLANLAVDAFIERCVAVDRANLVKLDRVSSVDSNGVLLTLMMTADLRGNFVPQWEEEDQTLEAVVWYGGRDSNHIKYDVLTVQVWHRGVEADDEDAELDGCIESESEVESDEEEPEQEQAVIEPFVTKFAELAMDDFNNSNPHIPYQVVSLLRVTKSSSGRFIVYTIRMTAKLKPPHDAKSTAPVQTFRAVIDHPCDPSQAAVISITIADPS